MDLIDMFQMFHALEMFGPIYDDIHDELLGFARPKRAHVIELTQLCSLVWDNKTQEVEELLRNGHDVNEKLNNGRTAIYIAVELGHTRMVALLIQHGANVNVQDPQGFTPLHLACFLRHKDIVQLLLSSKADVQAQSVKGTPILAATIWDHSTKGSDPYDIVSLLIEYGANVNDICKSNGLGPLHYAVKVYNLRMVNLLIAAKADVNVSVLTTNRGKIPLLIYVVDQELVEIVESFMTAENLDRNICDEYLNTPLHYACERGHLQIVKLLVEGKFDVNAQSINRETSLHLALGMKHFRVAKYLLEQETINVNIPMVDEALPLHMDIFSETHSNIKKKVLRTVINKTNNLNAEKIDKKNNTKVTALQLAVAHNDLVTAKFLIKKGAKVDISQSHMMSQNRSPSPLQMAIICDANSIEMVNLLLCNGAEVNDGYYDVPDQKKPLTLAIKVGCFEIVKALQNFGVEINKEAICANLSMARKSSCDSELDERQKINDLLKLNLKMLKNVRLNKYDDVKKNIEAGACVNVSHEQYGSPLIYASWKGYEDIVDLLLDNSANVNFKSATGFTSLHMACRHHTDSKIIRKLLLHGSYYNIIDNKNKNTPLKYAEMGRNDDACKLLQTIDSVFEGMRMEKLYSTMDVLSVMKNNEEVNFNVMKHVKNNAGQTLINMVRDLYGTCTSHAEIIEKLQLLLKPN